MPCPFFEPQRTLAQPQHPNARLPLIDEYDGLCHAGPEPIAVPAGLRFQGCNQGYSRGSCDHFPAAEIRSGLRYNVVRQTAAMLEVLYIEEQSYAPLQWQRVQYFIESGQLEPQLSDRCVRAQFLAFCRSYLQHFSD
jgi:hypothetical protein